MNSETTSPEQPQQSYAPTITVKLNIVAIRATVNRRFIALSPTYLWCEICYQVQLEPPYTRSSIPSTVIV